MNRPTTLVSVITLALIISSLFAPVAKAEDAANLAQNNAMELTRIVNEATRIRSEMPSDVSSRMEGYLTRLGLARSSLQTYGSDLASRSSKITMKEERASWLRTYVESAIERHNRAMDAINAEARRLNQWGRELENRIVIHNRSAGTPKTKAQVVAYDAKARQLNNEARRLKDAWASLKTREARDIEPMRLEISKRKRALHLKIAEIKRDIIAYNDIVAKVNSTIQKAKKDADALASLVNEAIERANKKAQQDVAAQVK